MSKKKKTIKEITQKKKPVASPKSSMGVDDFGAYLPDKATIKAQKRAFKGREYTEEEFRKYNLNRQANEYDNDEKYDLLTYAEKV
jgi:hypothetical protein